MEDEIKKEQKEEEKHEEKPLDKMTVKELRDIAREIPETTGVHVMKKDELLGLIKKHEGIKDKADKAPAEEPKKKKVKVVLDAKALKGKIIQLREQKETAQGQGDKKKIAMLRRRIGRLKKQTRKIARA
jgi:hypothetical protein